MEGSPIGTLAALGVLDTARMTVRGETVDVVSEYAVHEDGRITVIAAEQDGDRKFKIRTEWAGGWLEPLVDVCDTDADEPSFEPLGTLVAITPAEFPRVEA